MQTLKGTFDFTDAFCDSGAFDVKEVGEYFSHAQEEKIPLIIPPDTWIDLFLVMDNAPCMLPERGVFFPAVYILFKLSITSSIICLFSLIFPVFMQQILPGKMPV